MKKYLLPILASLVLLACDSNNKTQSSTEASAPPAAGQSGVKDDESQKDVVKVAVGSPDHTSLVKAIQAAELVDALSNAGPFTVFAPTNAAFEKLPTGTVEDLLKPENKAKLQDILQHHVMTSALDVNFFNDGQTFGMVDGTNVTIHKKGSDMYVDKAKIVASIRASNGIVYVVDSVILPPQKK
ncbi:MAG: fasciclin domain-containing protein [Spirosomataceae bacterium]